MKIVKNGALWLVNNIEELIACIAIAAMLLVVMLNVILRYVFSSPTAWSDEVAIIGMSYVTFVGGAAAYKRNLHFGIDILIEKMPAKIQRLMRQIMTLAFVILFAIMTYLGVNLTMSAQKVMNYTGWSYKIMDAALPLGFCSMTIYSIKFFILSLNNPDKFDDRYKKMYADSDDDNAEKGGEKA